MSERLDAVTEPNDLSSDPAAPDAATPEQQDDQSSNDPATPEQQAEAIDAIEARLGQIENELAVADAQIKEATATMVELRRERDRLNAQRSPRAAMSQAQAHAAIVAAGQSQRAQRFAQVQQFKAITGGVIPAVDTPAERAAKTKPRTV